MNVLLISISLAAALGGNVLKKYYTNKATSGSTAVFLYNTIVGLVSAIVLFAWGGIARVSLFTLLLGVIFGLVTTLQTVTMLKALQIGPMSYTSLITSFSTLIPTLSGVLFFGESIEAAHIIGIVLMLISFLCAIEKRADEKETSVKWLALCCVAFLCTGGIGVMQKVHQRSVYKDELNAFLVVAFAVSFLCSAVMAIAYSKREKTALLPKTEKGKINGLLLGGVALAGGCVAVNNKLNLYLSGVMDSAMFFPIVNGGGLVLTTLGAVLIFKERLSKKQWCGVVIGILSVILLCNPFA
ncbi:MAG: EamA family transporter [Clostridia bacterium]|nr:EamA family transporter [Clostridia bacterium]